MREKGHAEQTGGLLLGLNQRVCFQSVTRLKYPPQLQKCTVLTDSSQTVDDDVGDCISVGNGNTAFEGPSYFVNNLTTVP